MAPVHVTLRAATAHDIPAMQALFTRTIRAVCRHDYAPAGIEAWVTAAQDGARWAAKLATQYLVVAESAGEMVGFASLDGVDDFDLLYVHAEHQRQGIARHLYQAIEQEAMRRGALALYADVSLTARPFFEKAGFAVLAERSVTLQGVALRQYQMEKPLR